MKEVKEASELAGEPIWNYLPTMSIKRQIKGMFADLKILVAGRWGSHNCWLFLGEL